VRTVSKDFRGAGFGIVVGDATDSTWTGYQPIGTALEGADDTIALFDDFSSAQSHGNQVANVLDRGTSATQQDFRRVGIGASASPFTRIDTWLTEFLTSFLGNTTSALEDILEDPANQIRVINQSQGTSEVRVLFDLLGRWSSASVAVRQGMQAELGLPAQATRAQVRAALVPYIDQVFETNPQIVAARSRYLEVSRAIAERGIVHVLAAGNEGDQLKSIDNLGIPHDDDFATSILVNEHKIVAAASTGNGLQMASFTAPNPFTTTAMDGTGIATGFGFTSDGTSFSSPQVAAVVAELQRIDPGLSPEDIERIIIEASTDTPAPPEIDGAGILDPQRAFALAL
jgi:hypothetical protein